ncbi:MAG: restriction endonuclease subunit S [Acidaminococcaceae bacterium]|nr:restriction endonuclease subunit S [Acidaminococcaceae bacterium]
MDKFGDNARIHWKEFKLVDVFDVYNTKSILKEQIIPNSGNIPYVTAGESNNAVMTYVDCPAAWIDRGDCILIGGKTMVVTYQKDDFCSNDSHNLALYLKEKNIEADERLYLFLVTVIKKALGEKYVWGDSISRKKIQKDVILLPVENDGKVAWNYMQERIAELEQERIAELEAYLVATGLDDYELTDADKQVLIKMSTRGGTLSRMEVMKALLEFSGKNF